MYGIGILKGLGVTIKHFVDTYVNDLAWRGTKQTQATFELRQGTQSAGINTVEYPDEKLAVPERFRFVPFLIVNNYDDPHAPGHDWCTSCGICAKVCPPQCIWIVRGTHADTGRPKPEPEAFYIDIDICMNCGYCSEFCPFDAIKMDHDYELAEFDRTTEHIFDKKKLSKEVRYWQSIAPTTNLEEAILRGQWEHKDTLKVAKKANIPMTEPAWEKRDAAIHNPEIVAAKQAAAAPRPVAGAPAPAAAAPVSVSLDVDGADPDQLAGWSADESLPLAARAAAAVKLESMIQEKTFKPTSTHRKAVSAAKKSAKDSDTTIDDAAKGFKSGQVVTTAPTAAPAPVAAPVATAPSAAPAAVSIDVEGANPDQLAEWASNEGLPLAAQAAAAVKLDGMIRNKEFKPTSAHRKAISAAKKVAKDADTTIEDAAANFTAGEVVAAAPVVATASAAPQEAAPAPTEAPVAAPSGGSVDVANANPDQLAEWASNESLSLQDRASAAVKLDGMIRAKEFKPTSNHRKAISLAKKAAVDADTTIEDAAQ